MTRDHLQQLIDLGRQRDEEHAKWLQHVLLMASGALTVLVALDTGEGTTGIARIALLLTWGFLGLGILSGSTALYGNVWRSRRLVRNLQEEYTRVLRQIENGDTDATPGPVATGKPPWPIRAGSTVCATSLTLATVCLVGFAILKG